MEANCFLHALLIGKQKTRFLSDEEVKNWTPNQGFLWIHLDLNNPKAREWVLNQSGLTDWESEPFLEIEGNRPRCLNQKNGIFLVLRAINVNSDEEEDEDMIFFHLFCEKNRMITGQDVPVFVLQELKRKLLLGIAPHTMGEILDEICSGILDQTVALLLDMDDEVDAFEDVLDEEEEDEDLISDISEIRRKLVGIRRYLVPERDVFELLPRQNAGWLTSEDKYNLRENQNRIMRVMEDMDSLKERIQIISDELNAKYREDSQKNMYMLSVIAALFVPLSFITGLLGINVGGIPFAQSSYGFLIICLILLVFCLIMLFIFRKMKWI